MFSVLRYSAVHQACPLALRFFPTFTKSSPARFPSLLTRTLAAKIDMSLSPSPKSKVLVLGAGTFGSCLADHLGDSEHQVYMWSRHASCVEYFNVHHRNPTYLKDHVFSANIRAVGPEIPDREMIQQMDVVLFAIPTQGLR